MVERKLAESRNKAQAMILAGQVRLAQQNRNHSCVMSPESKDKEFPNARPTTHDLRLPLKPGTLIPENSEIEVKELPRFVSRGGEKLQAALNRWKELKSGVSLKDKVCLDIGCSSGGFTDCLLQNGAKKVYAVDVGTGQMHPKLRGDPRVELYEQTHILHWTPPWKKIDTQSSILDSGNDHNKNQPQAASHKPPSLVTLDVSFISLRKVLPKVLEFFTSPLTILCLFKPQFEVGARYIRKGIVRDNKIRQEAILKMLDFCEALDLEIIDHFPCPVLGAKGNQEEWIYLRKGKMSAN